MPTITKNQLLAQQNVTCEPNPNGFVQFTTSGAKGANQTYSLLAQDNISYGVIPGPNPYSNSPVALYGLIAYDLVEACAKPTNTSATMLCGPLDLGYSKNFVRSCVASPCQFNSANFLSIDDAQTVGAGTVQFGRMISDNSAVSGFEQCAKDKLPSVVAARLSASPALSSGSAKNAGSSKKLAVAAALTAAALLVIQTA